MKYIYTDDDGVVQFSRYFEYLEKVRRLNCKPIMDFAADRARYSLHDPRTLHDSWLESLLVVETGRPADGEPREMRIDLKLLGPYHDRYFTFHYEGVRRYAIQCQEFGEHPPCRTHGDLLYFEITVMDDGSTSHELLFSSGQSIHIECSEMTVAEEIAAMC